MVWLALPPHAGDKPWMGCGGDGAVGIGIGAGILLWGAMGGGGEFGLGMGLGFFCFILGSPSLARGVVCSGPCLGGGVWWGGRAISGGHSLGHFSVSFLRS